MIERKVASAGVHLSVQDGGRREGPTLILIHGFPDNQHVWDRVVPLLTPRFHVVTYDVRGAGGSSAPADRRGYAMDRLIDDLVAVIERVRPDGGPVHLVGHDWGAVQSWSAVMREATDTRLSGRISSYTSICGPGLDILGDFLASSLRNRDIGRLLRHLSHSWYLAAFRIPHAPEFVFGRFGDRVRNTLIRRQHLEESAHWSDSFDADAINGVNLYRANGLGARTSVVRVPVQLIVATRDSFISPDVFDDVELFAPTVQRFDIAAGHWVIRTHPEFVADRIATFVEEQTI